MSQSGLKVKVGALIIVALALGVAFVVLLGNFSVGDQRTLFVEFTDSGSMRKGAPVKIAGVRAGRVIAVEFLATKDARRSVIGANTAPVNVRAQIQVDEAMAGAVRRDSGFFITTQGVLGEKYLEIVPGVAPEAWPDGSYIRGEDPPRLDLLMARADNILQKVEAAMGGTESLDLGKLVRNLTRLAGNLDEIVATNKARINSLFVSVDATANDAQALVAALKEGVGSSARIDRIVGNTERLTASAARHVEPTLVAARSTMRNADQALSSARKLVDDLSPEVTATVKRLPSVAKRADDTLRDAQYIVGALRKGQGTVGQLIVDQEIYDDLKEMLRDLKRHPWKMLWRE